MKDDLISRQAAIDAMEQAKEQYFDRKVIIGKMQDIVNNLPSAQQEQRWIPCSERLPEPRVDVWTCSDIGQIQGYYEEHVGIWYASFGQGRDYLELYVTAWMPLPEPYKAERREE